MMFFKKNKSHHSQNKKKDDLITIDQALEALKKSVFQDSIYYHDVLADVFQRKKNGEKIDFNKMTKIKPFTSIYKKMPYLDMAIRYFPREAFQYLIENGAKMKKDIIHNIINYQSHFHYEYDDVDNLVKFMKNHGANLNALDSDFHSALYNADQFLKGERRKNYVKALLKYDAKSAAHEKMSEWYESISLKP